MHRRLLKFVNDVSPLSGAVPPYDATRWSAEAQMSVDNVIYHPNGFTTTVFRNPLITWHRSFSIDNKPVPTSSTSLIHVEEWVPGAQNNIRQHGFRSFGLPRRHGIAELPIDGPVISNWRQHSKRHLKTFQKHNEVTLRLGTLAEIKKPYFRSAIPQTMKAGLWRLCERHLVDHPETIEVMVAETARDGIVAGFVAGECREASTSFYILGFYLPPAKEPHAMVGLVHMWFDRTRAKQLAYCNFGDMTGPNPLPFDSEIGYSLFKTTFGIRRVWYPGSHWKISFRGTIRSA